MALQTNWTSGQVLTASAMNTLQANDYNWTVSNKTASYVLVAADKGTRVVMNNAGATTITVNTSLFAAGDTVYIHNIGAGVCTITAGTATVTSADVLTVNQWQSGVLYFTSTSAAIWFPSAKTASAGGFVRLSGETTFSASSSVTLDNIFTSTYRNYKIFVNYTTSGSNNLIFRVRTGGSSISTATYNIQYIAGDAATAAAGRTSSTTSITVGNATQGSFNASTEITVYNPQVATPTTLTAVTNTPNSAYTTLYSAVWAGNNTNATSYDGFELLSASTTITGNYTVYGLATS